VTSREGAPSPLSELNHRVIGQVTGRVCGHRYEPNGEDKDQGDAALKPIVDRAAAVSMVWTLHAQLDSRTAPAGLRARADSFTSSPWAAPNSPLAAGSDEDQR
jgi:hypothetical protein